MARRRADRNSLYRDLLGAVRDIVNEAGAVAVLNVAQILMERIQVAAPVGRRTRWTPKTADSVRIVKGKTPGYLVVQVTANQAVFQEYGTIKAEAHAFVRPAAAELRQELAQG